MGNFIIMLSTLAVTLQANTESTEDYLRNQEQQQQLLTEHAIFPEEGKQHQQLALSLRNQRLLEEQAESRARQLQYQLQAAEAMHAIAANFPFWCLLPRCRRVMKKSRMFHSKPI